MHLLPPLWCAGKLGNCPETVESFRIISCLICRWRRRYYGKYSTPPYYIDYTYTSWKKTWVADYYDDHGLRFKMKDGSKLKIVEYRTVNIDPRGRFTCFRCAAIIVLDHIMKMFKIGKPLAEFCEFLANYPIY